MEGFKKHLLRVLVLGQAGRENSKLEIQLQRSSLMFRHRRVLLPTCVQPDSYPEGDVWHVSHFECSHRAEDVQGHVGYLSRVLVSIAFWEP